MYRHEVMNLIKSNIAFLGTVDGEQPRVRPMKPFLCEHGHIWLFSHLLAKKVDELHDNDRVELCFVGEGDEVLRLSGVLDINPNLTGEEFHGLKVKVFNEMPQMKKYFTGPRDPLMIVYRLRVRHVIYTTKDNEVATQVDFATEDDPDILFGTDHGLYLS